MLLLVGIVLVVLVVFVFAKIRAANRLEYINNFIPPTGLYERLQKRRPQLKAEDCRVINEGLRQFFMVYLKSGKQHISMPSQLVDDLWHEFILYTRQYERFCLKAFGGFLHHTPAVVLRSNRQNNAGLRRCWWHACKLENINPKQPTHLPLLFALDAQFNIADGFRYYTDCRSMRDKFGATNDHGSVIYCGGDFSDTGIDGSLDGFGDSGFSSDSGSTSESGCSGDGGCSGGCGD